MYHQLTLTDIQKNKKLAKTWDLVCQAHQGQTRKGHNKNDETIPYTAHLFRVMEITANALGNPHLVLQNEKLTPFLIMALTHDTIEDTVLNSKKKLTDALIPIVGEYRAIQIAHVVSELSNPADGFPGATKTEQDTNKKIWQTNHTQNMSIPAKIIKMADQIANTADCVDLQMSCKEKSGWSDDKKKSYSDKALAVCEACLCHTERVSDVQKNVFAFLMNLEKQVYHYAMQKIQIPHTDDMTFFEQLNGKMLPENEPWYLLKHTAPLPPSAHNADFSHTRV